MSVHQIKYSYLDVPTVERFSESDAFIRGLTGPFGSGKSSGCVTEIANRAQAQKFSPDGKRKSRFACIRNTYPELRNTTIKTLFQWLPPAHFGHYVDNRHTYTIKAFEKCEIEVVFLALDKPDDLKQLLSLELTGAWVNEAREVPWAVIDVLQGRVGRYPAMVDGGPSWSGIWMDTNPPDTDSKWYKFFEEKNWEADFRKLKEEGHLPISMKPEDYAAIFKQPGGLTPQAENIRNLPGGKLYYARLRAGKEAEWIKVYVDGDYGFVIDGKPVYSNYNDAIHCKPCDPIEGSVIYRGWDFGLCYSDDTEVMTASGWKLFKDVDETRDLIATRNPETGELEYAPAAFKIAKPFKGELLEWASTELNMLVTPEHRVPYTHRDHPNEVRWESAEWLAQNMGSHHMVDLLSDWRGEDVGIDIGNIAWSAHQYAAFMGLYLSEGSVDGKRVTIYQKNIDPLMARILSETGLDWRRIENGKAAGWRVYHPALAKHLAAFGRAKEKRVPSLIRMASAETIRAFIWAYTAGDGHVRRRDNGAVEHTLFTTSKAMAGDMQELAQKAGWNSSMRMVKPQLSVLDGRRIQNGGGYSITFKKRAARAELHKRNFRRVPYDGMVYCLNVPHHTLYVRRNGKPHWNGNTPACVFSQLLPDGRWIVFDEMVSTSMGIDRFSDQVLEHCARAFHGGGARFKDDGDPAGQKRSETDEKTCFQILQSKGIDIEASEVSLTKRLESVRYPLGRPAPNWEGAMFQVHPRCKMIRKGFLGGYRFRRMQVSGERYTDEPDKNEYSHPHDAMQYTACRLFGDIITSNRVVEEPPPFSGDVSFGGDGRSEYTGY